MTWSAAMQSPPPAESPANTMFEGETGVWLEETFPLHSAPARIKKYSKAFPSGMVTSYKILVSLIVYFSLIGILILNHGFP